MGKQKVSVERWVRVDNAIGTEVDHVTEEGTALHAKMEHMVNIVFEHGDRKLQYLPIRGGISTTHTCKIVPLSVPRLSGAITPSWHGDVPQRR